MADVNIFEKFGVKEVANVYFEALEDNAAFGESKGDIVLFLDTLKVSSIETTAESVDARGGWGNPKLVTWDFGKEITLTLEDALLSLESARIMLGGKIKSAKTAGQTVVVHYNAQITLGEGGQFTETVIENPSTKNAFKADDLKIRANADGEQIGKYINLTQGFRGTFTFTSNKPTLTAAEGNTNKKGDKIRLFWEVEKNSESAGNAAVEITISPDTFPGTYKIVGDTFMRNQNGKDYPFQFIIGRAKVLSEVTLSMEAEGDPSTFSMTINVLKDENGDMMKMIRYSEEEAEEASDAGEATT